MLAKKWVELDKLIARHGPVSAMSPEALLICALCSGRGQEHRSLGQFAGIGDWPNKRRRSLAPIMYANGSTTWKIKPWASTAIGESMIKRLHFKHSPFVTSQKRSSIFWTRWVREHSKASPGDRQLPRFRGFIALKRGDLVAAKRNIERACRPMSDKWLCKIGLCVSVNGGNVVEHFKASSDPNAFDTFADACLREKDAAQLKALIETHAAKEPEDPGTGRWQLGISDACQRLRRRRAMACRAQWRPASTAGRDDYNDRLVRA